MDDAQIGARVALLRGAMPQRHIISVMAMIHGITWYQSTLTRVEAGQRSLKLSEALALAKIFGVPVGALVEEGSSGGNALAIRELNAVKADLEKRIRGLS